MLPGSAVWMLVYVTRFGRLMLVYVTRFGRLMAKDSNDVDWIYVIMSVSIEQTRMTECRCYLMICSTNYRKLVELRVTGRVPVERKIISVFDVFEIYDNNIKYYHYYQPWSNIIIVDPSIFQTHHTHCSNHYTPQTHHTNCRPSNHYTP